jgi:hypothetical protein
VLPPPHTHTPNTTTTTPNITPVTTTAAPAFQLRRWTLLMNVWLATMVCCLFVIPYAQLYGFDEAENAGEQTTCKLFTL